MPPKPPSPGPHPLDLNPYERLEFEERENRRSNNDTDPHATLSSRQEGLRRRAALGKNVQISHDEESKEDEGYFARNGRLSSPEDTKTGEGKGKKSPLMGTLKLDDFRDTLEAGIERKQVYLTYAGAAGILIMDEQVCPLTYPT